MKHAVIFANGEIRDKESARKLAESADYLIAADGGLTHLQQLGLRGHLLIGDLDSVTAEQIKEAEASGFEIRRFQVDKDETDLELALIAAAEKGCEKITVTAALGGRLDQTLSNIYLMNLPQLSGVDVRLDDGTEEVFLIRDWSEIAGTPGDIVSLLPLSPIVHGITTTSLKYPLINEDLIFYRSRGISNVMQSWTARVEIESGILLCVHLRKEE